MLEIVVDEREFFNDSTSEFMTVPKTKIQLEHSLKAISEWECKYEKSFFSKTDRTQEELLDYIKMMTLNKVDDMVYYALTKKDVVAIKDYMTRKMSARTYNNKNKKGYSFITSEDIYFGMIMNGIPLECENWHFNKLLSLLTYCNIHGNASGKTSKRDQAQAYAQMRELNAARRKALGSKG